MDPFVDLHAHFLPGLDDGARDAESSRQIIGVLKSLGFGHVHATPHQRAGRFMPDRASIDAAHQQIRAESALSCPGLVVGLGAENFWDDVFHQRLREGGLPCYSDSKAFLFEVNPALLPPRIETTLFEIRLGGGLPVMAHPERYLILQGDLGRAEQIGQSAALMVDLGALDGAHGRAEMKTARRLVEEGLAHAAASDIHAPEDQRAIAGGMAWIRKRLGAEGLQRLLADNPRRILAGDLP